MPRCAPVNMAPQSKRQMQDEIGGKLESQDCRAMRLLCVFLIQWSLFTLCQTAFLTFESFLPIKN